MTVDVARALDPSLQRTLSAFEATGVRWVVLRGRDQLPAPGHDIDLLVAREDLPLVEDIVFALGGVALPRRVHPWHRMYLLDRTGAPRLLLDVVTEVVFNRELRLASGLEEGILARRRWDGIAQVMDPSDLFWTVLLHCLLDKQDFKPNRRTELVGALPDLVRDSPGELYYAHLAAGALAAEEVIELVRREDWPALVEAGVDLVRRLGPAVEVSDPGHRLAPRRRAPSAASSVGSRVRRLLAAAYPHLWRRAGLGATPRAPYVAQDAHVPVRIEDIRRRPLLCTSVLLAEAGHVGRLEAALRDDGFVKVLGARYRIVATGVERALVGTSPARATSRGEGAVTVTRTPHRIPRPVGARRRRPVVVSFSGLDGAGKTRQIDALMEAIGAERVVELRWVPFKIWPEGLLNRLPAGFRSRLGPQRTGGGAASPASGATNRPTTSAARRALWWVIGTLASVSGGLSLRRRAAETSADVLVLDRYRLDAAVKLQFWYPDVSAHWLARVVDSLAPKPDLEFLLRIDPEVAYARKPEQWSVRQLTRQAGLYDGLAQARDVVVLDAEDEPQRIAAAVETEVRRVLDDR